MLSPEERELVEQYFRDWWEAVLSRGTIAMPVAPIALLQRAAAEHENARVRRECLGILDHEANEASTHVFVAALGDDVARVRLFALHGLSCERCRSEELCVADVVPTLAQTLASDPSPKVRQRAVGILNGLAARDARALDALRAAAVDDSDALVRDAARAAVDGRFGVTEWSRKAMRRRERRRAAAGT
jgi:hypothetical protein